MDLFIRFSGTMGLHMGFALFRSTVFAFLILAFTSASIAQTFNERMDDWPLDLTIGGTIIASSDVRPTDDQMEYFQSAAGGENARILHVQGGSESKTNAGWDDVQEYLPCSLEEWNLESFNDISGIWIQCGKSNSAEIEKQMIALRVPLAELIAQGGVLWVTGPVANSLGKFQIEEVSNESSSRTITGVALQAGLNLVPDVILLSEDVTSGVEAHDSLLLSALSLHPRCIGIRQEPKTSLILRGRKIRALGEGNLHFASMANDRLPLRRKSIAGASGRRMNPYLTLVDLTAWRRDAIDRTLPVFPAVEPELPHVKNGTLMIVGGGGMPEGMMKQFVELAGGEDAHLVFIPCREQIETSRRDQGMVQAWKRLGVASATVVHTKDRTRANSDQEFLAPLKQATGIFFGGGRQWNFSDSYYGTESHRLMKDVLRKGGVIAGSSAGASIQGRYLARANPLGNFDIMAPGYERGGLGFLSGVAIDQHFSQRRRQSDMSSLVNRYPQLLGIGIDETTAIVVQKSVAEVVGKGKVFFYDRNAVASHDEPDYLALENGKKYDLAKREVIEITKADVRD